MAYRSAWLCRSRQERAHKQLHPERQSESQERRTRRMYSGDLDLFYMLSYLVSRIDCRRLRERCVDKSRPIFGAVGRLEPRLFCFFFACLPLTDGHVHYLISSGPHDRRQLRASPRCQLGLRARQSAPKPARLHSKDQAVRPQLPKPKLRHCHHPRCPATTPRAVSSPTTHQILD